MTIAPDFERVIDALPEAAPPLPHLENAATLSAREAQAALTEDDIVEHRRELAMIERTLAARAATLTLIQLATPSLMLRHRLRRWLRRIIDRRDNAAGPAASVVASGLFVAAWYARQHHADLRGAAPIDHFATRGLAANLAPNPFFDPAWYFATHAEARASGDPAILHYVARGARQMLAPGPLFDAIAYAARYPDVGETTDLLAHYLTQGLFEGRIVTPVRIAYSD